METVIINIATLIKSPSALTREQGTVVYKRIVQNLNVGNKVILDFKEVESIITPFLNVSIGKLYETFNSTQLNKQLEIKNIPGGTKVKFQMVITNAKQYYSNKGAFSKTVEDVINN
ncbi:MAG: STAS-like domain-containing protein [Eisenbergiella sp.]|nr:STAS-like domain-containing protein [Bacillota bacterium]